ncbi:MAG: YdcF family protein [Gemmatimonadetes bacterium]|nr:YdcF family protein [Gemmatimonadota bacterium]
MRRLLWVATALVVAGLGAYALRAPALAGLGRFLTVEDRLSPADLIYLLNGGLYTRPFYAKLLHGAGLAPRIATARLPDPPTVTLGIQPNSTDVAVRLLKELGVPDSAITVLTVPAGVTSTADEAQALRAFVDGGGVRRIIVVTSGYHTRRARWIFRKVFAGLPVEILMAPAANGQFDESNWWKSEQGLIAYVNEYLKIAHYLVNGIE